MKVIIAGAGVGSERNFTYEFTEAVKAADVVLTADRLGESLKKYNDNVQTMGVTETVEYIKEKASAEGTVLVAASGDTGFYSIASTISKRVDVPVEIQYMAGIGSLAYFAAKIKLGYENMKLISLHGKEKSIVPFVCYNRYVFSLSGGYLKAHDIIKELCEAGLKDAYVYVGENLSCWEERILEGRAEELLGLEFEDLAVLIIRNDNFASMYRTLRDEDFIRGKSPMTKAAVRNLSVSALEIQPGDVVYDVGAGTGSVTCAMALKACESTVYAVEKEPEALELLQQNMDKLGILNIKYREGLAPEGMEDFPPADKVFIGGSSGNMASIVDEILKKNEKTVFVVTAITLETINEAVQVFNSKEFDTEISCINASVAKKLGRYNMMLAENPVYIVRGVKKFDS